MQNDGFLPVTVFQDDRYTNVFYWGLLPKFCVYWNLNREKKSRRTQAWKNCTLPCRQAQHVFHATDWVNLDEFCACTRSICFFFLTSHDIIRLPPWLNYVWRILALSQTTLLLVQDSTAPRPEERGVVVGYSDPCARRCRPCVIDIGWIWVNGVGAQLPNGIKVPFYFGINSP